MSTYLIAFFAMGIAIFIYLIFVSTAKLMKKTEINTRKRLENIFKEKTIIEEEIEKIRVRKKRFKKVKVSQQFKKDLIVAGISLRPEEFVIFWIALAFVPGMLMTFLGFHMVSTLVVVLICGLIPPLYVNMKRKKKMTLFSKQLGDALVIISNSLKAGFTFEQALVNIAKDLPDPIASEFGQVSRELDLGNSLEESLFSLGKRMQSPDLDLLTTTVVIQKQIGGNLADIIETISETIRDRVIIKNTIKTLTAQGRISGMVVAMIPVAIIAFITVINPEYMMPLFTTTFGYTLLGIGGFLELIGLLFIRKIVNLKID